MKSEVHSSVGHYPDALGAVCKLLNPGVDFYIVLPYCIP